jgi:hypothetical protein
MNLFLNFFENNYHNFRKIKEVIANMINIGNAKHIIDNIPTSLNVCRQKQQYPS